MLRKKERILVSFLCFMFLMVLCEGVNAADLTWTGGGSDNLASNPANWSGGAAPRDGDSVIFDGTSSKDCTWDLTVKLALLTQRFAYTGKVTKTSGIRLTVAKDFIWTGGGGDNLASNPANWSKSAVPADGSRVIFDNTSPENCIWDINAAPALFDMSSSYSGAVTLNAALAISGNLRVEGGYLNLNNKDLDVDGYLYIGPGGTIDATSSTITVAGDWENRGSFIAGSSTVVLAGANQTIYGNTDFFNLIKITLYTDTLYFEAGSTQTIAGNLILRGEAGNLLSLRSTVDGNYWNINAQGTRDISFADIRDMNNTGPVIIDAADSSDSGNNTNINFGEEQCACRGKGSIFALDFSDDRRRLC
jgi:hypothetical protein